LAARTTDRLLKRGSRWRHVVPIEPSWIWAPESLDLPRLIVVQNRLYFNRDRLNATTPYSHRATAIGAARSADGRSVVVEALHAGRRRSGKHRAPPQTGKQARFRPATLRIAISGPRLGSG